MFNQNLHTHSTFDDGQNTMEDMVRAALAAGLCSIGISVHTSLPFSENPGWTIDENRMPNYLAEARRLKAAYRGRISVYCGAEYDGLSQLSLTGFDYVIGSVHYIVKNAEVYSVDATADIVAGYLTCEFGGDTDAAAELYFRQYATLADIDEVDIVGHFDLLTKFDEQRSFYNTDSPRYRSAAFAAMEALVAAGKIFEINTGAIARGYRTTPYPSRALLTALSEMGGRVTISSDAHREQDVIFGYAEAVQLAHNCGFTELYHLTEDGFKSIPIKI